MIILIVLIATSLLIANLAFKYIFRKKRVKNSIAFFHLYCSSGGGGERVLWHTVQALLNRYPEYTIYIYSHNGIKQQSKMNILLNVRRLFKIDLMTNESDLDRIEFVPLNWSALIEAKRYPYLTLLCQSIGSIILGFEAARKLTPEIYIETIGFAFTLPIFKLISSRVITYVHYPTISRDMIDNVKLGTHASYNNREIFVKYGFFRRLKLLYYKALVALYGFAGRRADLVLVNSSWTRNHIDSLWQVKSHVVYPPCDTNNFRMINNSRSGDSKQQNGGGGPTNNNSLNIISIAQFRPEKNHQLQIEAFDSYLAETGAFESKLVLYGGCRDDSDKARVRYLRDFINRLELSSNVEIIVGATFEKLLEGMKSADVAIHTMENEHFGIVLVECMAAGLICVAHNSGGPRADIIDDNENGFLANDIDEFSQKLTLISKMSQEDRQVFRDNAIKKSERFSAKIFEDSFLKLIGPYMRK